MPYGAAAAPFPAAAAPPAKRAAPSPRCVVRVLGTLCLAVAFGAAALLAALRADPAALAGRTATLWAPQSFAVPPSQQTSGPLTVDISAVLCGSVAISSVTAPNATAVQLSGISAVCTATFTASAVFSAWIPSEAAGGGGENGTVEVLFGGRSSATLSFSRGGLATAPALADCQALLTVTRVRANSSAGPDSPVVRMLTSDRALRSRMEQAADQRSCAEARRRAAAQIPAVDRAVSLAAACAVAAAAALLLLGSVSRPAPGGSAATPAAGERRPLLPAAERPLPDAARAPVGGSGQAAS
eukprot:TRINITY_DN19099_c1_g4_i1.p1 TRINITY_DN19099_c1_g4~~TRINITY_DN19099_c1_g4_i1.p1  ORF type:complete len:326 (+),score=91.12 TRINITY_DN19099_c1_g4_i1:83-979(+)